MTIVTAKTQLKQETQTMTIKAIHKDTLTVVTHIGDEHMLNLLKQCGYIILEVQS